MRRLTPLLPAFVLLACGPGRFLVPRNESEEPVFRQSHFASAGGSGGFASTEAGYYLQPLIWCEANVSPWASFTNLPLYWNFLLSGDQYDGETLQRDRLHLSLHGGLAGLAYSSRDGWEFPGNVILQGKYLTGSWFLVPAVGVDLHDLREPASTAGRASLSLGYQADDRNSLRVGYGFTRYQLPGGRSLDHRGVAFRDGETRSDLQVRHSLYLAGRHVLGPEAGVSIRNRDPAENHSLSAGFHYRYVFD